jgi:hypothetical protein
MVPLPNACGVTGNPLKIFGYEEYSVSTADLHTSHRFLIADIATDPIWGTDFRTIGYLLD